MFSLKRHVIIRLSDKTILSDTTETIELEPGKKQKVKNIEIPLFVYSPLPPEDDVEIYTLKKATGGRYSRRTEKTTISAKFPGGIGANLRKEYSKAISRSYKLLATCYEKLDLLALKSVDFEIGAIWIPTIDSLNVKHEVEIKPIKLDPAMILRLCGKSFLITIWEVNDEKPIEHYIRESRYLTKTQSKAILDGLSYQNT